MTTFDSEAYLTHFTDDIVLLPPDRAAISGKTAALSFYETAFEGIVGLRLDYTEPSIEISGDLAVRRYEGTAYLKFKDSPDEVVVRNKYLDVLKRQDNGLWKISIHTWSDNE